MKTKILVSTLLSLISLSVFADVKSRIVGESSCLYWGEYNGQKAINEVFAVYTVLNKRHSTSIQSKKFFKEGYVPCNRLKDEHLKQVCLSDEQNTLKLLRVKDLVSTLEHEAGYDSTYSWNRHLEVLPRLKDCMKNYKQGF